MKAIRQTGAVTAWQVADLSTHGWNNVYGIHQFKDEQTNLWELIDNTAGDEINLYINCHQAVAMSNHVLDPSQDYSLLLAKIIDKIIRHDA